MSSVSGDKIDAMLRAHVEATQETSDITREIAEHTRRMRRIANAQRQKVLEQVLATSGIDLSSLHELHDRSEESDKRFYETMTARINENSKNITRQHKIRLGAMKKRFPDQPLRPHDAAPHAGTILTTADRINVVGSSAVVTDYSESTGPEANVIRFHLGTEDSMRMFVATVFDWTTPIAGTLDVIAAILPNGSWRYSSQYKCVEASGELKLNFYILISLNGGNFDPSQFGGENSFDEHWSSFSHVDGSGIVSEPLDLEMQYPVQAGDQILLAVVTQLTSWASESHTEIDFASADPETGYFNYLYLAVQ